ncbi:MAG: hypothetical protein AABZ30_03420 [Myxococcota bacterium]
MRGGLAILAALALGGSALADKRTTLVEVDMRSGRASRIDAESEAGDADLDAALGRALGSSGFSTRELERAWSALRDDLRRLRPRATAQLLVFAYPGRVSLERLRTLSEVIVDVELTIDPCDRAVCADSAGAHIEAVGRAVGRAVHETPRYRLSFRTLILRGVVPMHDAELQEWRVPMEDCIAAAARPGGGRAWLDGLRRAADEFEPLVATAVARQASARRVALASPPEVSRSGGCRSPSEGTCEATVKLKVRGDRSRFEQQALDALAAAAAGLRENPTAPAVSRIEVEVSAGGRGAASKRFRAPGHAIALWLDGRLDAAKLWQSYIQEVREEEEALAFDFSADEAASAPPTGGAAGAVDEAAEPSDAEVDAILDRHFGAFSECVGAEAERNARFTGVTITFRWMPSGVAADVAPKEPNLRGGALERCLAAALASAKLPRFRGAPRAVSFPMTIKR